jgi:signal peptidase I
METAPSRFKGISEDLLSSGMDVRTSTRGFSMYPLISTGDRITINAAKNLGIGDIIVFKRNDQMVCHRMVRVFEKDGMNYYQTRGDSFFNLDEPVTLDQILGKVIWIERENMSLPRRILLSIYPALKFGRFNAFVITALVKLRAMCTSANKQ